MVEKMRNKNSGDYSNTGETELHCTHCGKKIKWQPPYIDWGYCTCGTTKATIDTGSYWEQKELKEKRDKQNKWWRKK